MNPSPKSSSSQPKDFQHYLEQQISSQNEQRVSIDPNIFVGEETLAQINRNNHQAHSVTVTLQSIMTALFYPLTAIHTSLQLSVIPHQNIYGNMNPSSSTALAKTTQEIQPHDKRKFELLVKSGVVGANRPYQAPVYASYAECIRGLANQGWLGFYKGNLLGLMHLACNSYIKFSFLQSLDYRNDQFWHHGHQLYRQLVAFGAIAFADAATNTILLLQSRFILQNRLPEFRTYKSINQAIKKHMINKRELLNGTQAHFIKNFLFICSLTPLNWSTWLQEHFMVYFLTAFHLINYPFLTAIRRLHCQSALPGMIPKRYGGATHAIKLIFIEEGLKGLYRGFPLYLISSLGIQLMLL